MSNFLAKGKRKANMRQKMSTRKHVKKFYKILHELDRVAAKMIESGIYVNADNVVFEAGKYTDRRIDTYEKNILLSKVNQVYDLIRGQAILDSEKEEEE